MGNSSWDKRKSSPDADIDASIAPDDRRLSALLEAIEAERVPDRLLKLAEELQQELFLRKQKRMPN